MKFLTDFADQAVVLPVIATVAIILWWYGSTRAVAAWLIGIGTTFAIILALKWGFMACPAVFGPADLHSPSGHVAAAGVVSGGAAAILGWRGWRLYGFAAAVALAIGCTRTELGAHTWAEVVLGGAIALAGVAGIARWAGTAVRLPWARAAFAVAVVAGVFHGRHLDAEPTIQMAARAAVWFPAACGGGGLVR